MEDFLGSGNTEKVAKLGKWWAMFPLCSLFAVTWEEGGRERQAAWQAQVLTSYSSGVRWYRDKLLLNITYLRNNIMYYANCLFHRVHNSSARHWAYKDNIQVFTGPLNVPTSSSLSGWLGFLILYMKENDSNSQLPSKYQKSPVSSFWNIEVLAGCISIPCRVVGCVCGVVYFASSEPPYVEEDRRA